MSIQPIEAPAINLELIVGEMPEMPCEHGGHAFDPIYHDKGDATHYVHGACKCGRDLVFAACLSFVNIIKADAELRCSQCNTYRPASQFLRILGPVK